MQTRLLVRGFVLALVLLAPTVAAGRSAVAQEEAGGTISGRVTYVDGSPVARYLLPWSSAGEPIASRSVLTDEKGAYVISGLKPGTYLVGLFTEQRVPADRNSGVEPIADRIGDRGPVFGRKVVLQDNETVAGIDFVITDIGPERGAGPDTGGDDLARLPGAGSGAGGSGGAGWIQYVVLLLVAASAALLVPLRAAKRR
jgi:hypothetical protein